jgi:hypothetical protein
MQKNNIIPKSRVWATISSDYWKFCVENELEFSELLNFAIEFKMAEMDLKEFPFNSLSEKIRRLADKLNNLNEVEDGKEI